MGNDMNKNIQNNDIIELRNELYKANIIIKQHKLKFSELGNKLNNNTNSYNNIIIQKDIELNNLRSQLIMLQNNNQIFNNVNANEILYVNFISMDQQINYSIPCVRRNTFAEIEEKLYKQYPQYRDTNNIFLANGTQILIFKTIEENRIRNGLTITLVVPS
jgi:hypothetical protein